MADAGSSTRTTSAEENYARTQFLLRVAHDLRGPAGVAMGALDEISGALERGETTGLAPLLRIAQRAQAKVLRVAEKLARAATLAGADPFAFAPVPLAPILDRAKIAAETVEARKNIRCTLASLDPTLAIRGDAGWLEMILVELVADAITHARTEVRLDAIASTESVTIEITCDGRTNPPQPRALFEPDDGRRGLGLSMSIASRVMDAHGGAFESGDIGGRPGVRLRFPRTV